MSGQRKFTNTRRRGAASPMSVVLILVVLAAVIFALKQRSASLSNAQLSEQSISSTVAGTDTAPQHAPTAEQAIGAFNVRDTSGAIVPLVTPGEPSIVMISSLTCGWCKKALKDLGELSAGRPLPRLKYLTLEGAAEGKAMLDKEHLTGAQLIGPASSNDEVLLTFRYPGTPTFIAIDRNGRVVATMPGYPMFEVMKSWYAVMVGDQDVP